MRSAVFAATLFGSVAFAQTLQAACPTADPLWCYTTGGTNLSGPAGVRAATFARAFVGNGTKLLSLDPTLGTASTGYAAPTVGSVDTHVMPVELTADGSGLWRTFVASSDGYVYSINAQTGACLWKTYTGRTSVADSARTVSCAASVTESCPNDTLSATPLIWIGRYANAAYGPTDDRVIIGTRYISGGTGCSVSGGSVDQRFILNASTGAVIKKLTIGAPVYAGMGVDYDHGVVFGNGTSTTGSSFGVYSPVDLTLLCAQTLGPLQASPVYSYSATVTNKVYVVDSTANTGTVRAINLTGCTRTSCTACPVAYSTTIGSAVTLDFAVDARGTSNRLFFTSADGKVHTYTDNGTAFTASGTYSPAGGKLATSVSPVLYSNNKFFVGQNDGQIAQIDLSTCTASSCTAEKTKMLQTSTTVGDIFQDANSAYTLHWLYVGNDAGLFARINAPF